MFWAMFSSWRNFSKFRNNISCLSFNKTHQITWIAILKSKNKTILSQMEKYTRTSTNQTLNDETLAWINFCRRNTEWSLSKNMLFPNKFLNRWVIIVKLSLNMQKQNKTGVLKKVKFGMDNHRLANCPSFRGTVPRFEAKKGEILPCVPLFSKICM